MIRTRNLLIWSQTRYRCAKESLMAELSNSIKKFDPEIGILLEERAAVACTLFVRSCEYVSSISGAATHSTFHQVGNTDIHLVSTPKTPITVTMPSSSMRSLVASRPWQRTLSRLKSTRGALSARNRWKAPSSSGKGSLETCKTRVSNHRFW